MRQCSSALLSVLLAEVNILVSKSVYIVFFKAEKSSMGSVSDPDPVGFAFNLGVEPGSGIRIQMSKNRFKKPKFTLTDFKDENTFSRIYYSWQFSLISYC